MKSVPYAIVRVFSIGTLFLLIGSSSSIPPLSPFPILQKDGFLIAYDPRSRIPFWTYERITSHKSVTASDVSCSSFKEEVLIAPIHRSRLSDYYHSQYDRGHMVPVANQKLRGGSIEETYSLANVCPQVPSFNRGAWAKFEKSIRLEIVNFDQIDIITGPLFLPKEENGRKFVCYEVIGEKNVAVPTHFFKILRFTSGEEACTKAYILPNHCICNSPPPDSYEVTIETVEGFAGIIAEQIFKLKSEN